VSDDRMTATPMHAADLLTIVATGNGQDVVDAVEAMTVLHGQFLTALMMRAVLDRLDVEKLMQLRDWNFGGEPMRWTPAPAEPVDDAATLAATEPATDPEQDPADGNAT
jgi:hypothetical protein